VHHELPTGSVTLLFTDVEGSTKLLRELGAEAYAQALAAHRQVIREACAHHDGVEVDTQGDAFFVAFATAPAALAAAAELTEAHASGPIRVRVGLHTGTLLHFFWTSRGAWAEEHERLRGLLALDGLPRQSRAELLVRLSDVEMHLGRVEAGGVTARKAQALAEPGTEPHWLAVAELAFHALHRGDAEEAVRLGRQALEEAERLDDTVRIWAIGHLATILMGVNRAQEARPVYERFVHEARRSGLQNFEAVGLADLGWLDLLEHDYESARAAYAAALTQLRGRGDKYYELETLRGLGLASLGLGKRGEARAVLAEMLELALAATQTYSLYVAQALSGIALAASPAEADRAALLRGAVARLSSDADVVTNAYFRGDELDCHFESQLVALLGEEAWEREKTAGSTMTLEQAIALAQSLAGHSAQAVAAEP
jgi:tetratricopeptide (TPR) repeat protein